MPVNMSLICISVRKISLALATPEFELSSVLGHVEVQTSSIPEHFRTFRALYGFRIPLVLSCVISSYCISHLVLYLEDQKQKKNSLYFNQCKPFFFKFLRSNI